MQLYNYNVKFCCNYSITGFSKLKNSSINVKSIYPTKKNINRHAII